MPLYEYQCKKCEERTEVVRRFSDPPLTTCEACGGELTKLVSSPAIQFKGSGFYITDYARPGGGNGKPKSSDGGSSGDAGSAADSSGSTRSDAKTEAKTEAKSESKSESKKDSGSPKSSD